MNYSEKLKDPRWQRKRLEILNRDEFMCRICGDTTSTLHIHHRLYLGNNNPWDYPNELLVTLCEQCHEGEKSEEMKKSCDRLVAAVKAKFYTWEIDKISSGFEQYEVSFISDICAASIEFFLSDPNLNSQMIDTYFQYLKEKREAKDGEKIH